MAARRSRRRRRRGRFGFLYKLLSFILILCAIVAGCIVFFRVEEITVVGSTIYSDEEIAAAAGVKRGDNLFLVGKVQTARRLIAQLPYIKEASLRYALPNTLVIHIAECTPAGALQGEDGSWWILDKSGKLLAQADAAQLGAYPRITGLTPLMPSAGSGLAVSVETNAKLDSLKQLLAALEELGMLEQTQSIDLSGASEIQMGYENRFCVCLPMYSDDFRLLAHTVQQAAAAPELAAGQTGTLDLTVPDGRPHFIPDP